LPEKKSIKWIYFIISVLIINYSALLLSRVIQSTKIDLKNILGFAILSAIISLISFSGYWGIKYFTLVFLLSDLAGIVYLFFIVLSKASGGWSDLTSIIGYMVIICFGIIAGITAEVIFRLVKRKNKVL